MGDMATISIGLLGVIFIVIPEPATTITGIAMTAYAADKLTKGDDK